MSNALKTLVLVSISIFVCSTYSQQSSPSAPKSPEKPIAIDSQKKPVVKQAKSVTVPPAKAPAGASLSKDTLTLLARLIEIPGKFPPNDLYNYVFIMKYRVVKVLSGSYIPQEILVGHYNPLIPRKQIKDKMASCVKGNVAKFEPNALHTLVVIKPIEGVWKDAVEDDYPDSDLEKYFALKTDITQ